MTSEPRNLHAELLVEDTKVALYRDLDGQPAIVITCEPGTKVIMNGNRIA